jgi:hypothetical protein
MLKRYSDRNGTATELLTGYKPKQSSGSVPCYSTTMVVKSLSIERNRDFLEYSYLAVPFNNERHRHATVF